MFLSGRPCVGPAVLNGQGFTGYGKGLFVGLSGQGVSLGS
jgi:hypothetical protein